MSGRELVEQHFRSRGIYVMRSELERLVGEAEFYVRAMAPMLAVLVDAPITVPAALHRVLWLKMLERVLDDAEEKERERAEVEDVLQEIEIATREGLPE